MYYIESVIQNKTIFEIIKFNREELKQAIIDHLVKFPSDTLIYYKTSIDNVLIGDDVLGFYEVNPRNGKPSKCILKGDKTFYKSLE